VTTREEVARYEAGLDVRDEDILAIVRAAPGLMSVIRAQLGRADRVFALSPQAIMRIIADMGALTHERIVVVALRQDLSVLDTCVMAVGSTAGACTSPGAILQYVMRAGAGRFMLVHNHPSGTLSPSGADRVFTDKVLAAARTCEVQFTDHIIVAGADFFSFRHAGLMGYDA
jgi:DNA repair protein RadC